MEIVNRNIDDLIFAEYNPRQLSEKDHKSLTDSIKRFGLVDPLIVNMHPERTNILVGGHQRARIAKELGFTEVPTVEVSLTLDRERELNIRLNRNNGSWDFDMLANHFDVEDLTDWGFDLSELDFATEIEPAEEDENVNLEAPKEPVTVLGDLYELNEHRVHCGDSTDIGVVDKTLNGAKPYLMITDPPYGVVYEPEWRNNALREDGRPSADRATGKVENDDKADWTDAWSISPAKVAYVYHADRFSPTVAQSLESCGFEIRNMIIWAKNNFAISRGHYHHKHEPCWYAVKKGDKSYWIGDHSQTTLWEIDKPMKSDTGHGTQKPVECMALPMRNHEGDIYEPFLGSGTTLIAAEQNNRIVYAQELSPAYIDVSIRRWLKFMRDNNKPYTVKRNGKVLNEEELKEFEL